MALIELFDVSKDFQQKDNSVQALDHINLSVDRSDIYGIIGMSGAGKSTLVRCLNYLESPSSGDVVIDGKKLGSLSNSELRNERRKIGMIFQHFNLLTQKNVVDNVAFPLRLKKVNKRESRKKAMEMLELVGLADKAKAYPAQLSGGQQQRVAIARALASDPNILLCDEATSALDPQTTESILDLLKQINKEFGITIVIITHQMSVVQKICNKVAIIEEGKVVEKGNVDSIFSNPKSKAAKKLIFGAGESEKPIDYLVQPEIHSFRKIRAVFSKNSSFEPVIANMILKFQTPVNILKADTKNVGGIAKGVIVLGLPDDEKVQNQMMEYLVNCGLSVQEVTEDV